MRSTRTRDLTKMEIREADHKDFPVLVMLTEIEGWNYTEEDFNWFSRVGGKTLVATNMGEIVGMGTIFDYGNVGWISNILVKPRERGHGIGAEILTECVRRLYDKSTVALFSYERSADFYEANGFRLDLEAHLVSLKSGDAIGGRVEVLVGAEVEASMLRMDQECFGYERRRVIKGMAERGIVLKARGWDGFAIVRKDPIEPSVGPVISEKAAGHELLLASLEAAGPNAKAVVLEEGIRFLIYEEKIRRLYLGAPLRIDRNRAVAFAGLELG